MLLTGSWEYDGSKHCRKDGVPTSGYISWSIIIHFRSWWVKTHKEWDCTLLDYHIDSKCTVAAKHTTIVVNCPLIDKTGLPNLLQMLTMSTPTCLWISLQKSDWYTFSLRLNNIHFQFNQEAFWKFT